MDNRNKTLQVKELLSIKTTIFIYFLMDGINEEPQSNLKFKVFVEFYFLFKIP